MTSKVPLSCRSAVSNYRGPHPATLSLSLSLSLSRARARVASVVEIKEPSLHASHQNALQTLHHSGQALNKARQGLIALLTDVTSQDILGEPQHEAAFSQYITVLQEEKAKVDKAEHALSELLKARTQYAPLALCAQRVFSLLQRLEAVSPLYAVSLTSFIETFTKFLWNYMGAGLVASKEQELEAAASDFEVPPLHKPAISI